MIEDKVVKLIEEARDLRRREFTKVAELDAQIVELQTKRARLVEPLVERRKKIEEILRRLFDQNQVIAKSFVDAVVYKASYFRRGWDLEGLAALADKHPEAWKIIKRFRKMTPIDSQLRIKD